MQVARVNMQSKVAVGEGMSTEWTEPGSYASLQSSVSVMKVWIYTKIIVFCFLKISCNIYFLFIFLSLNKVLLQHMRMCSTGLQLNL